jgi:hypothetical protein
MEAGMRDHRNEMQEFGTALLGQAKGKWSKGSAVAGADGSQGMPTALGASLEARLRDLQDHVNAADRNRRIELQMFRNELMGELGTIKDSFESVNTSVKRHLDLQGDGNRSRTDGQALPVGDLHEMVSYLTIMPEKRHD